MFHGVIMARQHILIIPAFYPFPIDQINGTFFREQAQALGSAGCQVGVISAKLRSRKRIKQTRGDFEKGLIRLQDENVLTYYYFGHKWPKLPMRAFTYRKQWEITAHRLFTRYVKDNGWPDLIHAHCALPAGIMALALKKRYNLPYVVTEHKSSYKRGKVGGWKIRTARKVFKNSDARIAVSPELGKLLESMIGKSFTPWQWLPNMLGSSFAANDNIIQSDHDEFVFLNIAMLREIKGQRELLQAFAKFFKDKPETQLRIGGDGLLRQELICLAEQLGISEQVAFLGTLNRDQVQQEMNCCDAFVLPSHYETFGVVLIEALSCGRPIVATACGGPECIVAPHNGVLVPAQDVTALGEAMLLVQKQISQYNSFDIRRKCLENFGPENVANKLLEIYSQICVT